MFKLSNFLKWGCVVVCPTLIFFLLTPNLKEKAPEYLSASTAVINICSFYFNLSGSSVTKLYLSIQYNPFCSCCFPEQSSLDVSGRICNLFFQMCSAKYEGNILGNHLVFIGRYVKSKLTKGSRGSDICLPSPPPPLINLLF